MDTEVITPDLHRILEAQQHNIRQPVSSCPSEILESIFQHLVPPSPSDKDDWIAQDLRGFKQFSSDDLIACSQVCSLWRSLIIHLPSLWDKIWISDEFGSSSKLEMIDQRSRERPLEVAIFERRIPRFGRVIRRLRPMVGPILSPVVKFSLALSGSMSRIQTLRISSHIPWKHSCTHFLTFPAPQLEYFSMRATTEDGNGNSVHIPLTLFAHYTPALKHLILEGQLDFTWNCPIFRNLTTLKIQPLLVRPPEYGIRRLLRLARECPNLVALSLSQDAFRDALDGIEDVSPVVRAYMPSLDRLELEDFDNAQSCRRFLSFIHAPALTFLEISHRGPCVDVIGSLLPRSFAFHSRSQESNFVKVVASEGRGNSRNGIHVALAIVSTLHEYGDASLISLYRQHRTFQCQLLYHASGSPKSTPFLTVGILRRLCPSPENVEALLVRSLEHFRRSLPYQDMLDYFPAIEALEVVYDRDNLNQECWQLFEYFGSMARSGSDSLAVSSITRITIDLPTLPLAAIRNLVAFLEHQVAQDQRISYLGIPELMDVENSLSTIPSLTSLVGRLVRVPALSKDYDQLESRWTDIGGFRIL
ncbi:hypothetical protein SCHPADRAFT_248752 [Schizopora paradoxa]|uniref:F-box domain-containing protein n=1 Tax=Schizopora paradoxa TaxID=27342 RepID=A0A0H2RUR5_9AGAM|nr:hypothetical protein SCHPADRAFT_248752 [Schizopora paradoxa]